MTTEDIRNAVISAAHDAGDELNRLAGNLAAAEASLAAQRSTIADLSDYLADALRMIESSDLFAVDKAHPVAQGGPQGPEAFFVAGIIDDF